MMCQLVLAGRWLVFYTYSDPRNGGCSMNHTPVALQGLLERFQRERHQLSGVDYSAERLCQDYIEPLLIALGWDVANYAGARDNKKPVEALFLPVAATGRRVYA